MNPSVSLFWSWAGVAAAGLFFASFAPAVLLIRQKKYSAVLPALLLSGLCYCILQSISTYCSGSGKEAAAAVSAWFVSLPRIFIILLFLLIGGIGVLAVRGLYIYEKTNITLVSIKEAADNLPSGICFYQPGGRVIMDNQTMKDFCRAVTGDVLVNGEVFCGRVLEGRLTEGCRTVAIGLEKVIIQKDGTAWSIKEKSLDYRNEPIHMVVVSDITERYQKTLSLQGLQQELVSVTSRLAEYNREIVSLTAQKELLSARVRMHDEMGAYLLTMKHYIQNGGNEKERADIETRLLQNVSFLKTAVVPPEKDEYELLTETAEKLGVQIVIDGTLPAGEPQKPVIATAIHECFTNTLRHARGSKLSVAVHEEGNRLIAVFTNDGVQPSGEIKEKGGLSILRMMAEQAGGSVRIVVSPVFAVIVDLPKEDGNGL